MDTQLQNEIELYLLNWIPANPMIESPRQKEIALISRMMQEMRKVQEEAEVALIRAKRLVTLANDWQQKYLKCKNEVAILRQRKTYYKTLYLRTRTEAQM